MLLKKNVYNAKIKNIQDKILGITNLATKTILNATINEVKVEIPRITNLTTTAALNAKTNEVKGKIPSITNLGSTTALTAAENTYVSNFVKKLIITQKLVELKRKLLIVITINILLLQNLIS